MQRAPQNIALLVLGILIALVGAVLPLASGNLFRNGAPAVLAVIVIGKGSSTLACKASDVVLSAVMFVLVLLSKIVPASFVSPITFHMVALILLPIFAMTGLTLKAIANGRDRSKQSRQDTISQP